MEELMNVGELKKHLALYPDSQEVLVIQTPRGADGTDRGVEFFITRIRLGGKEPIIEVRQTAKLSGFVHKVGEEFWATIDMPPAEPQDPEHPSTFGFTEEVGPFKTEAEGQEFLDTGRLKKKS
jgi:hypothetical protein